MSFANIRMYNAVLPTIPKNKDKDGNKPGNVISGDDPANRDAINKAMFDVNEDEQ